MPRRSFVLGLFFLFMAILGAAAQAAEEPIFGRYVGVLRHEKTKRDQLARLDFIFARDPSGGIPHINATLTLYFGDFTSSEYVSYHYEVVRYSPLQGVLIFNTDEIPLTLVTTKFDGKDLVADVTGVWAGEIGTLRLKRNEAASPELPLLRPLFGEHEGECGGVKTKLQLLTYRSNRNITGPANPFSAYEVRGQLVDRTLYQNGSWAITDMIRAGSYDFFQDELTLTTRQGRIVCRTGEKGLACRGPKGSCQFTWPASSTKTLLPPQAPAAFPMVSDPGNEPDVLRSGTYVGYIHHEFLDRYQLGRLTLKVFKAPNDATRVSATGEMVFGLNGSIPEAIPLKFEEVTYPTPLGPQQVLVLSNRKVDIDATVQVYSYRAGVIRGVWFSHIFGRVGTFEFRKRELGLPALPPGAETFGKVSGEYRAGNQLLNVSVRQENTPLNTANPFAPNILEGSTAIEGLTYPRLITSGSYDFYTGRIALEGEANPTIPGGIEGAPRPTRVFVGQRDSREAITLWHSSGVWGGLSPFTPSEFRLRPVVAP